MVRKRNGGIDVLRLLFALCVVFHHFNLVYHTGIVRNGYIGVEFFYLVTGFLTAKHVSGRAGQPVAADRAGQETWTFILKKVRSFYRYYLAGILLQLIVLDRLIRHHSVMKMAYTVLEGLPALTLTFMGLDLRSRSLYIGGMWYLSAMVIALFLLYPVMLKNLSFALTYLFPLLSLFVLGYIYHENGSISAWDSWTGIVYCGILRAAAEIALGASLFALTEVFVRRYGHLLRTDRKAERLLFTLAKTGCFALAIAFAYGSVFGHRLKRSFDLPLLFILAAGVVLSFAGAGFCIPDSAVTRFCGKISLGIYIFHSVILRCLTKVTGSSGIPAARVLMYIGATVGASVLLMYAVDLVCAGLLRAVRRPGRL